MRAPRIVFASLAVLTLALGSRLALVEVRAHSEGSVLLLRLTMSEGDEIPCPLSVVDGNRGSCKGLARIDNQDLAYSVTLLRKEDERVLLSVRSEYPGNARSLSASEVKSFPEIQQWFTPGETIPLSIAGASKLTMTGEWLDHRPVLPGETIDPAAGELRVISPIVLKNGSVAGDLKGLSALASKSNRKIVMYVPGEGRFCLFAIPVTRATPGKVDLNRISFVDSGQSYELITGMPVSRADEVWVLHDRDQKPVGGGPDRPRIGVEPVTEAR